ncbi:MAG: WhiB family transcriptional regulator [Actinomycetota bacterium]|nr:WhiB family transcriptional regulator [Actinomycetota bacterium]
MADTRQLPQPVAEAWDWQLVAACRDVDTKVFFAPDAERGLRRLARERVAKAVCRSCPVVDACATYAVRTREPFGVWGGLTPEERRRLWSTDRARTA